MTLFSKKNKPLPDVFRTDWLPEKLRQQILWILAEQFPVQYANDNWIFIRNHLCKEHGRASLAGWAGHAEDLSNFIMHDPDVPLVLDAVQLFFQLLASNNGPYHSTPQKAISELNRFFLESGVGYEFDAESGELVPFDNKILHQEAVRPALHLLADPKFASANGEYLQAFEHFKHGQYGDCLTECCKALESTLKLILDEKGWKIDPKKNPTLQPLLTTYLKNAGLDGFWEQPIIVLGTLRSKMDAHGAGPTPHKVPQHFARYALNATGSAIVLLVDAVK